MKYKCKKSFCVDKYDDDGFLQVKLLGGNNERNNM